jgi:hypothetical protein
MDWVVPVSPEERTEGVMRPATETMALATLRQHGCVLLRGVYDPALIDALYAEFANRYGGLDAQRMKALALRPPPNPILEVGDARFEITVAMTGVFAQPDLFANPLLRRFLSGVLGSDMRLSGFTAVVSHPGAAMQHVHRDHAYLFGDNDPALNLPVYAINTAVPLIDVDAQTGPTAIWPGSHTWPQTIAPPPQTSFSVPFRRGDAVLMDYRTLHTGLPNRGTRARPILYMVYARPWFFDEVNHIGRTALDMPLEQFGRLPSEVQPLLSRAYSQAMRARWHLAARS